MTTCACGHHEAVHRRMCGAPEGCSCDKFVEAKERDTYRAWWMASEARMKVEREGRIRAEQERDAYRADWERSVTAHNAAIRERDAERTSREFWHNNAQETDTLLRECRAELRKVDAVPQVKSPEGSSEKQKDLLRRGDMARNFSTPQPSEPLVIPVEQEDIGGWADSPGLRLTITPSLARRIVAMGQPND